MTTSQHSEISGGFRAVTYLRVSTDDQALGLDAQRRTIGSLLVSRGWHETYTCTDEGVSGTVAPGARSGLADGLLKLAAGEADVLVVAKLDRIGRDLGDLCELLDLANSEGWEIVAADLGVDTTTPMGRAMAQMSGVFAELERQMIRTRTREALAAKKAQGARLGRPCEIDDATKRAAWELRGEGLTLQAVADALTEQGFAPARGGVWSRAKVRRAVMSYELDLEALQALAAA